jgi:hypothetical protein
MIFHVNRVRLPPLVVENTGYSKRIKNYLVISEDEI